MRRARRPVATRDRVVWLGLTVEPATHRERIAARARAQFEAGLIDEARSLRERFDPALPAFSAIGYREAWAVLDGTLGREAAIELDAQRNVAFAKRQRTWFRSEPDIDWLDATDALPVESALDTCMPSRGRHAPDMKRDRPADADRSRRSSRVLRGSRRALT